MTEELKQRIAAKVAEQAESDALGKQAAVNPFPGPLGDVFAVPASIPVGKWSVRPFYDLDVELLKFLNHPLYQDMTAGMRGEEPSSGFVSRGPDAWILAWIMTRDTDAAEALLANRKQCEDEARREFGKLRLPAIAQIVEACVRQMGLYSSTSLQYGAAEQKGEGEQNPPQAQ